MSDREQAVAKSVTGSMDTITYPTPVEVAASANFGRPSAQKRGRNPRWPYVPVVITTDEVGTDRTHQLPAKAFVTRQEALDYAASRIQAERDALARKLAEPQYRALREHYGLPRELVDYVR